jgi:hypothetical protein
VAAVVAVLVVVKSALVTRIKMPLVVAYNSRRALAEKPDRWQLTRDTVTQEHTPIDRASEVARANTSVGVSPKTLLLLLHSAAHSDVVAAVMVQDLNLI